jgi:peptide-methionine (S)-S-oxide reductase
MQEVVLGMGCFWGAERIYWDLPGVWVTSVGYSGGYTPNPTYREVCTGMTGHAEVVRVVFDPAEVSLEDVLVPLLGAARPDHADAPGQRRRHPVPLRHLRDRRRAAGRGRGQQARYQARLDEAGHGRITTEIALAGPYWFAEDEHQQYLAKNPGGYCNHGSARSPTTAAAHRHRRLTSRAPGAGADRPPQVLRAGPVRWRRLR